MTELIEHTSFALCYLMSGFRFFKYVLKQQSGALINTKLAFSCSVFIPPVHTKRSLIKTYSMTVMGLKMYSNV